MTDRLRAIYRRLDNSHPFFGVLIQRFYHRKALNGVKRVIHGNNNTVRYRNAILSSVFFDIKGNNNIIIVKEGCYLNDLTFRIRGDNHSILIDKHCSFYDGGLIWFEDSDCSLVIGERSTFGDVHLALTEPGSKIKIGRDCMFSSDIDVRTGDSHSIISLESNERINYAKDVCIDDHVWIAAHSVLLKGSVIPENSVVATGSVVTQCYDTRGIIIGGNPSKQIKEGITWSRERTYKTNQLKPRLL